MIEPKDASCHIVHVAMKGDWISRILRLPEASPANPPGEHVSKFVIEGRSFGNLGIDLGQSLHAGGCGIMLYRPPLGWLGLTQASY